MNTLMGKGTLFLPLLKKDINSYWELNAKLNASWATVVVVVQACYLQKVSLIIKQTYEVYSQWQKSSEIRTTVQICEKIRPFWGKTWRWFWKSLGQQEAAGPFLDTLGLVLINIIIPCKWKEIKIGPQSTGSILLGETHYDASVWTAHYSSVHCLFIIPCPLFKATRYKLECFEMFHVKRIKRKRDKAGLFLTLRKFPRFWNHVLYSIYSTVYLKTNKCRW